ncbi:VOC family protein [Pleomorphovibrio marinus]|uniref:VOC family protein n=1 Tax=Pleomorphovibrio marinus TaxID=2164132 RepID=UPI000E0AF223|nr:hypothetical protein [Pleomorphovibrio marinus]
MKPTFRGGLNIAVKIPKAKYQATLQFYGETLGLELEERPISHPEITRTHRVVFGPNILWLDCVPTKTHSETWLELRTEEMGLAEAYLHENGVRFCDEIEDIPKGMHWLTDPAGTVFILCENDSEQENK